MSKETFDLIKKEFKVIKKELKYVGLLFLSALLIFKIVFFKENLILLFRTVSSLFWLFALPGYCAMLYWNEKLELTERMIVGIGLSAAVTGISSYYIGLTGLNIKFHIVLLPLAIIILGITGAMLKKN